MKLYNEEFMNLNEMIIESGKNLLEIQKKSIDGATGKIDGIARNFLFRTSSNEYTEMYEQRVIVCDRDTSIGIGSVISDVLMNGEIVANPYKWLTISQVDVNQISQYAKVQRCNDILSFIVDGSNLINTVPFTFTSYISKNSDGTTGNKYFDFSNDIAKLMIPNNVLTSKLRMDQRLIFGHDEHNIYEITHVDNLSIPGLLTVSLRKSMYRPNDDNLELNIADYVTKNVVRDLIVLSGSEIEMQPNNTYQLSTECYENGVKVVNPIITYASSNIAVCTVNSSGLITCLTNGTSIITLTFNGVSKQVNVTSIAIVGDNYNVAITPSDVKMRTNRTISFNAMVTNNGIEALSRNVIWEVRNVDDTLNEYVTYSVNDKIITLTSKTIINKSIIIKAKLDIDNLIYSEREIKIVGY